MTVQRSQNDTPEVADFDDPAGDRVSSVSTRRLARALQDGMQFGKYRVVRLIAIGGMSEIYEAMHVGLRKRVALKVMRPDLAESTEARQRFIAEGVNAARIRHSNVVDVTDVGEVDELPYLVMALLDGQDLGVLYGLQGRIPIHEVIDLLLPVASAVAAGHAKGVVHRDLKPDNIFLHREGCRVIPKVLDFGVSRMMSARRITLNASVFGTPHYMSPEQACGAATDARADQYALGVILYEGITGRLPRDCANPLELLHSVAYDAVRPPSEYLELPAALEAVILQAMAREPDARFASMRELAMALVPFASADARDYWRLELGSASHEHAGQLSTALVVRHPSLPPRPPALRPQTLPRAARGTNRALKPLADRPIAADAPATPRVPPPRPASPVAAVPAVGPLAAEPEVGPLASETPGRPRRRQLSAAGIAAGGLLLVAGSSWFIGGMPYGDDVAHWLRLTGTRELDFYEVELQATPSSASILLDGVHVGVGRYAERLARNGKRHELRIVADGFASQSVSFQDEPPPANISLLATTAAPPHTTSDGSPGQTPVSTATSSDPAGPAAVGGGRLSPVTGPVAARAARTLRPWMRAQAARQNHAAPPQAAKAVEQRDVPASAAPEIAVRQPDDDTAQASIGSSKVQSAPRVRVLDGARPRVQLIH